jgi:hypothetical protein
MSDRTTTDRSATGRISTRYRRFAEREAREHSPLYEELAIGVANNAEVLEFLATLPEDKQQPNLLFAAVRHVCGTPSGWASFQSGLSARLSDVRAVMLARGTQTNEAARCAVLLPVLATLPGPLALIEVGASAGLCLLPDRYAYDYGAPGHSDDHGAHDHGAHDHGAHDRGTGSLRGPAAPPDAPVFTCRLSGGIRPPAAVPVVRWRAGLDLNPIDVTDGTQTDWLETLVWPDQPQRLMRLRQALAVARPDPPPVRRGNLLHDLPELMAQAPAGATLVVFHTAVLAYVADQVLREDFARHLRASSAVWISNEVPGVFPDIAAQVHTPRPNGAFLLAVNGRPFGWTDPHGAWLEGLGAAG